MTISDQIYRIEEDYSLPRDYMLCIHFFLDSLNTAPNALPEHILHELRHAQSFWQTGNSGYTLASGKKRVWEAINEAHTPSAINTLRAVLFVFEERPPTSDLFELLSWYIDYAENAGISADDITQALEKWFPDKTK